MKKNKTVFYVYEHWRPDIDVCFYVGKGHGKRAFNFKDGRERNHHYRKIVEELSRLGMCAEVRLVESGLCESAAFEAEIRRITFWKSLGVRLTNKSNGGKGPSGIIISEETRKKLSASISAGRIGMKFSKEHKYSLRLAKLGKPRKPFTEETRRKMREASSKREQLKRELYGDNVRQNSRIKGLA